MSESAVIRTVDGKRVDVFYGPELDAWGRWANEVISLHFNGRRRDFDAPAAAELATFCLAAAGPDAAHEALAKLEPAGNYDDLEGCGDHSCLIAKPKGQGTNGRCRCNEFTLRRALHRERARASLAEKRLAAVLALTFEDVRTLSTWQEIQALIRSRATEGAEAPTGATT